MNETVVLVSGWLLVLVALVVAVIAALSGQWVVVAAMVLCAGSVGVQVADL